MKEGFYDKIELELQGSRNTYYVGGLMAFELTERNSSYAMALVCKNFGTDSDLPMFPYTKVICHYAHINLSILWKCVAFMNIITDMCL